MNPESPPNIPDHELLRRIGSGGYGEVWLARSTTGAFRAVKIVYRKSFEHERPYEREFIGIHKFEPISRGHDTQVDILHVGRNDVEGYFYYIMELADDLITGRQIKPETYQPWTLKNYLEYRGRLPIDECLDIALHLAGAVDHLHKNNLVHRDIKLSNVIFINAVAMLADIGLVNSTDSTRSYVGTEGYLPREGPGSPQADLYSLGKVLYEISTGKSRFDFPELPTELRELPDRDRLLQLNEVILKACEDEVDQRYQSAEELLTDLWAIKSGQPLKRKKSTGRKLLAAGLGLFFVAIAAVGWFGFHKSGQDIQNAKVVTKFAEGLVSWWSAEDNAKDFAGTNHGILINEPKTIEGLVGKAFSFDGVDDMILVPDSESLRFSGPFSIELWMKVQGYRNPLAALITKGDHSWRLQRDFNGHSVLFSVNGVICKKPTGAPMDFAGTRTVDDGKWHHIAAVYDGAKEYIYVDGTLDKWTTTTGKPVTNNAAVAIGQNDETLGRAFNGLIDEVKVYNRALSADEVRTKASADGVLKNSAETIESTGNNTPTEPSMRLTTAPTPTSLPVNGVVYQTSFSSNTFQQGTIAGQDGWIVTGGMSSAATKVVLLNSNQSLVLSGPDMKKEPTKKDHYEVSLTRSLDFNPGLARAQHIRLNADVQFNLDPKAEKMKWIFTGVSLYFPNGPTETSLQMDKIGGLFSQTDSPHQHDVTGSGRFPTNGFHNLGIDCDMVRHRVTPYLDGRAFSIASIKPGCDTSAVFIKLWMASAKPTTTTVVVSNLIIRALDDDRTTMASTETTAVADENASSLILYETRFDSPQFHAGKLAGQSGWFALDGQSQHAARIISSGSSRHLLELSGPEIEITAPNLYTGKYFQTLSFDPKNSGKQRLSFSGDFQWFLGDKTKRATQSFALFFLRDKNGTGLACIGFDKHDSIFGQNFCSPHNQVVTSDTKGGSQLHNLRVDLDFTTRQAVYFVDDVSFGMVPINPSASDSVGSLWVSLESTAPMDSTLFVENISVKAFAADTSRPVDYNYTASARESDSNWIPLFDGTTLSGWTCSSDMKTPSNTGEWRIGPDKSVFSQGPGSVLLSPDAYTNFEFKAEIKLSHGANGGMFFRVESVSGNYRANGYEAQAAASGDASAKTGSLYHLKDISREIAPDETWFTQHIVAVGNRIVTKVNDEIAVDYVDENNTHRAGHLGLQQIFRGKRVTYRNVMVKPLPADNSAAWDEAKKDMPDLPALANTATKAAWISPDLPKPDGDGWIKLFDGRHLYGCSPSPADLDSGKISVQSDGTLRLESAHLVFGLKNRDGIIRAHLKNVSGQSNLGLRRDTQSEWKDCVTWFGDGNHFGIGQTKNQKWNNYFETRTRQKYSDFLQIEFRAEERNLILKANDRLLGDAKDNSVIAGQLAVGARDGVTLFKSIEARLLDK